MLGFRNRIRGRGQDQSSILGLDVTEEREARVLAALCLQRPANCRGCIRLGSNLGSQALSLGSGALGGSALGGGALGGGALGGGELGGGELGGALALLRFFFDKESYH